MDFTLLVKLTENDKRILIAVVLIFILLLLIFGYLFIFFKFIICRLGDCVDNYMYDLVKSEVVKTPQEFKKVGFEKSLRKFYFQARLPISVILILGLLFLLYCVFTQQSSSFFFPIVEDIFFKFGNWPTTKIFGITIVSNWPEVLEKPVFHLTANGIFSYFEFVGLTYGVIHYCICVLALIARNYRVRTLAHDFFKKDINKLKDLKENKDMENTQARINQEKIRKQSEEQVNSKQ